MDRNMFFRLILAICIAIIWCVPLVAAADSIEVKGNKAGISFCIRSGRS
jgi:hypothetical protein